MFSISKTAFTRYCLLFAFLTGIRSAYAQDADSLKAAMQSEKRYPQRINAYVAYLSKYALQDFDESIRIGAAGIGLARKHGDSAMVGQLKRHIGEGWYFKGNYDLAAAHFYDAIRILEKTSAKTQLANSYNALAKLYRKTRDLPRSLENYEKAMSIFRQLNDSAGISMIFNESGVVYEYAGAYDKAVERYTASLEIDRRRNDQMGMAYALSNLAGVYVLQNKQAEAERYLLQALSVRKMLNDSFALSLNYADLASNYNAWGKLGTAKNYLDSSNYLADLMGYRELKQSNYSVRSQIAEKEGDYQTALQYFKQRSALQDSIFGIEKTKQIEELNTRFETEKKERMIAQQQNEIQRKNLLIAGVATIVIMGGLLAHTQYRRYRWKQEARLNAAVLRQQELATKAVLEAEEGERQRIAKDLHDGIGQMMSAAKMNLSAYEHEAQFENEDQKHSFEKIILLVDESCKEIRAVSHNMMPNALLKNSLAAAVREFLDKLDHKSLKVHLYTEGLDERLDANTETVLYRVIQECVNNVIRHSGANVLDITLIREATEITATIEDNGKGFDTADRSKFDGIGMKNIRTRIEYLKGSVDFNSTPGKGTLVALHVPL